MLLGDLLLIYKLLVQVFHKIHFLEFFLHQLLLLVVQELYMLVVILLHQQKSCVFQMHNYVKFM